MKRWFRFTYKGIQKCRKHWYTAPLHRAKQKWPEGLQRYWRSFIYAHNREPTTDDIIAFIPTTTWLSSGWNVKVVEHLIGSGYLKEVPAATIVLRSLKGKDV